jgi:hypothetical protein
MNCYNASLKPGEENNFIPGWRALFPNGNWKLGLKAYSDDDDIVTDTNISFDVHVINSGNTF